MADTPDIRNIFGDVYAALDLSEQRKALRGAMRREGNRLRNAAAAKAASGLANRGGGSFKKNIRRSASTRRATALASWSVSRGATATTPR